MLPDAADGFSLFMLGFLGTGHCLGICGPLVVALPGQFGRWSAHLIYHLGRLSTYTLVGAILGSIGGGMSSIGGGPGAPLSWLVHLQVALSFFAAVLLVLFGFMRMGILREPSWLAIAGPAAVPVFDKALQGGHATKEDHGPVFCRDYVRHGRVRDNGCRHLNTGVQAAHTRTKRNM